MDEIIPKSAALDEHNAHRRSPAPSLELARELTAVLSLPRPLDEVEQIEHSIKQMWRAKLEESRMDPDDARAFVDFFRTVGFTYKYKPYGVKIASPFGYSIFDLKQNQGFSFQIHTRPKREAFHILQVKAEGFVFLCSREEWDLSGHDWVKRWAGEPGLLDESPFVWRPAPGQTIPVSDPEVVHSVVGCVLEEYASCSVDAVDRLFDQNKRSLDLPAEHPGIDDLLAGGHPSLPTSLVVRSQDSWERRDATDGMPIIDVPGSFHGRRVSVTKDRPFAVVARTGWVTTLMPVSGQVECLVAGIDLPLNVGEIVSIPPGWEATVQTQGTATLAVHSVCTELILQDWS